MAARISWNWCRASWGVSSRYEARHHRADRADLEGRTRGGGDRDPAGSVRGVVVGAGFEGRPWKYDRRGGGGGGGGPFGGLPPRPRPPPPFSRPPPHPLSSPPPPVPRDQVADGWDLLPIT